MICISFEIPLQKSGLDKVEVRCSIGVIRCSIGVYNFTLLKDGIEILYISTEPSFYKKFPSSY